MTARVRGKANNNPTKLLAYDTFLQTEGALSGKTLPLGGTWAGAGDAADFSVNAAGDYIKRTEVSDSNLNNGRYAIAGTEEPVSAKVSVLVKSGDWESGTNTQRRGVFLRYTNTENWLGGFVHNQPTFGSNRVAVIKRVAGVETVLHEETFDLHANTTGVTVALACGSTGTWQFSATRANETAPAAAWEGQDSVLATGGTLAKGKAGLYDAQTSAAVSERRFDNFTLLATEPAPVMLYSGKAAEIRSEGYFREDESGKYWGEFPPRGADLYLEPEGDSGRINRLVIVSRRNDVETEADSNVTDKISVEVRVRERFLIPR